MALFVVNNLIEEAAKRANAPTAQDFINNPFIERVPKVYIQPDYSPMYTIGALGICIVIAIFVAAVRARSTCISCGYSWKVGSKV